MSEISQAAIPPISGRRRRTDNAMRGLLLVATLLLAIRRTQRLYDAAERRESAERALRQSSRKDQSQ